MPPHLGIEEESVLLFLDPSPCRAMDSAKQMQAAPWEPMALWVAQATARGPMALVPITRLPAAQLAHFCLLGLGSESEATEAAAALRGEALCVGVGGG